MRYLVFFLFSLVFLPIHAQDQFKIFNAQGKEVNFDKIKKASLHKEFIFFGEHHDCASIHWFQLQLTTFLFNEFESNLVVGAEMFESDNQLIINEYFAGLISTKNFEDECRLWTNYKTDYKPIIEFLKEKNIPLIATNIPRRYANSVFHNGIEHLEKMDTISSSFFPPLPIAIDTLSSGYKEILKMGANNHKGQRMAEAQAIKDATMAHFILQFATDKKFLHLNGSFHSNNYEGILFYLLQHVNRDKCMVISMVAQKDISTLEDENKGIADFIFCFTEDYARSH